MVAIRFSWMLALAGLVASPLAAQTAPPPAKVKGFTVSLTGYATLPPVTPSAIGQSKQYHEKDVVFALPVAWQERARVAGPIAVHVADYDWPIAGDAVLTRASVATGGNLDTLPKDAAIYCGDYFKKSGGVEAHLLTLGLSSIASRLSNWLQTCVVDSDLDGKFDKGFLVGTKKAPDRILVDITPVAYNVTKLEPVPGGRVEVVYYDGGAFNSENFEIHFFIGDTRQALAGMTFPDNFPDPLVKEDKAIRKAREAERPSLLQWYFPIKADRIPQQFTVGDARFTVTAIDKVAKTATVTMDKDSAGFPFGTYQPVQTIYIYY